MKRPQDSRPRRTPAQWLWDNSAPVAVAAWAVAFVLALVAVWIPDPRLGGTAWVCGFTALVASYALAIWHM